MKFSLKNWQKERRLTLFFAVLALSLVFLVLITTYLLFDHYIKVILKDNSQNIAFFDKNIADVMQITYIEDKKAKTNSFQKLIKSTTDSGLLKYAYVINNDTKKILWSFDKNIINPNLNHNEFAQAIMEIQVGENIRELVKPLGENTDLVVAFTMNSSSSKEIDMIMVQIYLSFILFALFSFASSMFLGRVLQEPFDKLKYGIKKFGEGDFEFRVQKTPFIELNQIVDSYNKMASELDDLYNDLETKVVERTEALEKANKELKETQSIMIHAEKMRSLGELVAGIAHEINNPINFIYGNMVHFENYVNDIFTLFEKYEELKSKLSEIDFQEIEEYKDEIDIEFIKTDIKDIINSCRDGADRAKNIIADLKNFSRLDESTLTEFDIPKEIDTTLNILRNKYKNRIDIVKNYAENLPKIEAYGRQLNQVFMNILDNAIYAIKETGTITISSYVNDDFKTVSIEFKDSGVGIKEEDLKKVFDPFYTTKPVGEGTGLGMSIAYKVISSHNGWADVSSELGVGTTFRLVLPINQEKGKTDEV